MARVSANFSEDAFLIKTDPNGEVIWKYTYGGTSNDYGHEVLQTPDGGYIVAGWTCSYGVGCDGYVFKVDANGQLLWQRNFGKSGNDSFDSIVETPDGKYIAGGSVTSVSGFGAGLSDAYLVKFDGNGNMEWEQAYGSEAEDTCYDLNNTLDGGYIVTGLIGYWYSQPRDVFLMKLEPEVYPPVAATIDFDPDTLNLKASGNWATVYVELPEGHDVWQIDGKTVLLNGLVSAYLGKEGWAKAEGNSSNIMDHDGDGILERMVKFEMSAVQAILAPGDAVVVTVTGSVGTGTFEGQDVIRVIDKGKAKPGPDMATFAALAAFPQPCNPEVWIPYRLGETAEVSVTIYNAGGQMIRSIKLGDQPAGAYVTKDKAAYWDGRNEAGEPVASGIYFYSIQAGDFTAMKKMVVAK